MCLLQRSSHMQSEEGRIDPLCYLGPILTRPQPEDGASFLHSLLLLLRRLDEIERKLDRIMEERRNSHCHGVAIFQRRLIVAKFV